MPGRAVSVCPADLKGPLGERPGIVFRIEENLLDGWYDPKRDSPGKWSAEVHGQVGGGSRRLGEGQQRLRRAGRSKRSRRKSALNRVLTRLVCRGRPWSVSSLRGNSQARPLALLRMSLLGPEVTLYDGQRQPHPTPGSPRAPSSSLPPCHFPRALGCFREGGLKED